MARRERHSLSELSTSKNILMFALEKEKQQLLPAHHDVIRI